MLLKQSFPVPQVLELRQEHRSQCGSVACQRDPWQTGQMFDQLLRLESWLYHFLQCVTLNKQFHPSVKLSFLAWKLSDDQSTFRDIVEIN